MAYAKVTEFHRCGKTAGKSVKELAVSDASCLLVIRVLYDGLLKALHLLNLTRAEDGEAQNFVVVSALPTVICTEANKLCNVLMADDQAWQRFPPEYLLAVWQCLLLHLPHPLLSDGVLEFSALRDVVRVREELQKLSRPCLQIVAHVFGCAKRILSSKSSGFDWLTILNRFFCCCFGNPDALYVHWEIWSFLLDNSHAIFSDIVKHEMTDAAALGLTDFCSRCLNVQVKPGEPLFCRSSPIRDIVHVPCGVKQCAMVSVDLARPSTVPFACERFLPISIDVGRVGPATHSIVEAGEPEMVSSLQSSRSMSVCSSTDNDEIILKTDANLLPHIDFRLLLDHNSEPVPCSPRGIDADDDVHVSPRLHEVTKRKFEFSEFENKRSFMPAARLRISSFDNDEDQVEKLERKLKMAKRKLRCLEENFARAHGHHPNEFDRISCEQMKKYVVEIAGLKKRIKGIRSQEASPRIPQEVTSHIQRMISEEHTLEQDLKAAEDYVEHRRAVTNRPQCISEMSLAQKRQEKLLVQRVLLQLESAHGRPVNYSQRDLMRPLYDYYGDLKRSLAVMNSPRLSVSELQPIPEHDGVNHIDNLDIERERRKSGNDQWRPRCFTVVPNRAALMSAGLLRELALDDRPSLEPTDNQSDRCTLGELANSESESADDVAAEILHQMSPEQLYKICRALCEQKRALRRLIHSSEHAAAASVFANQKAGSWQPSFGTTVQMSEQAYRQGGSKMQQLHVEYKVVKGKLRLVEALLSKHRASC